MKEKALSSVLLQAVDDLDTIGGLIDALDLALEADDSANEVALRTLLLCIDRQVRAVRDAVQVARKPKEAPAE
jgi:hypothetical protein